MKLRLNRNVIPLIATIVVFLIMFGWAGYEYPSFFSIRNVVALFQNNASMGVVAVGMTLVILSEGIDLSVGAVIGFVSIFVSYMIMRQDVSPLAAWALALAIGICFGAGMGFLIHAFELPAFLVTLGGMFFARGMAFVVEAQVNIRISHPIYQFVQDHLNRAIDVNPDPRINVFLTSQIIVFLIMLLIGIYLTQYTRFGRTIYAIGGNENSAILMGLPVARTKILIYAFSGFCAALAGILYTFETGAGDPAAANGLELSAIAAVVIGGTLLTGGQGYVIGTLFGVLIYGSIKTLIDFNGRLDSSWQPIFVGILLLGFILLQKLLSRSGRTRD